jgi:DNA-binding protein H-NS
MKHDVFGAMSIDELWTLRQTIVSILEKKLEGEKAKLQDRLDELNRKPGRPLTEASRPRAHRKVNPKFRNPERPSETWAGRGKQPHWVSELLEAGRNMDEFRIA